MGSRQGGVVVGEKEVEADGGGGYISDRQKVLDFVECEVHKGGIIRFRFLI